MMSKQVEKKVKVQQNNLFQSDFRTKIEREERQHARLVSMSERILWLIVSCAIIALTGAAIAVLFINQLSGLG